MAVAITRTQTGIDREIAKRNAAARESVNGMFRAKREEYVTDLPGQDAMYRAKYDEAADFLAQSPEPTDLSPYPWMAQEVGVTAPTAYELAQLWVNLNQLWGTVVGPQLEGIRQQTVAAISAASSDAEIETILHSLRDTLAGI